jgi:hypothetical protein
MKKKKTSADAVAEVTKLFGKFENLVMVKFG